jgi:RimJ/RimL family protein N-acetyltransferase
MVIVADRSTGEVYGDLSIHLDEDGHTSEIGYTFDARHWSKGYAIESLEPMLDYLFEDVGVTRVFGMLHPDNPASAMVMERTGFRFEGHTRKSFWLEDDVSDDWIYGMVREDWEAWRNRVRMPPIEVRLIEISAANVADVVALETHRTQERFVARIDRSFSDALFPETVDGAPVVPWMRAIEADESLVGFVMLTLATDNHPEPHLRSLIIARQHQRRGIGGRALALVEGTCRASGDATLVTRWREGKGSPGPFFAAHGYVPTGRKVDDAIEARKALIS